MIKYSKLDIGYLKFNIENYWIRDPIRLIFNKYGSDPLQHSILSCYSPTAFNQASAINSAPAIDGCTPSGVQ